VESAITKGLCYVVDPMRSVIKRMV